MVLTWVSTLFRFEVISWLIKEAATFLAFLERSAEVVINLSKKRVGALFAIQREISLKDYLDSGVDGVPVNEH